jgi:hypothetical protein
VIVLPLKKGSGDGVGTAAAVYRKRDAECYRHYRQSHRLLALLQLTERRSENSGALWSKAFFPFFASAKEALS